MRLGRHLAGMVSHDAIRKSDSTAATFDVRWLHATGSRSGVDNNARASLHIMANALRHWRTW